MEGRGIESRRQLLYFERTTKTREKERDEFGDENETKGAPAKRTTVDAWSERARKNETKRLDPKILSVNKRLDSKDVSELNDH